mgnify:CR=1 FL=1
MKNEYMEQVKAMCMLLYPANTNIDYFPTNFVVQNGLLYYIDFECNDYMEEWSNMVLPSIYSFKILSFSMSASIISGTLIPIFFNLLPFQQLKRS